MSVCLSVCLFVVYPSVCREQRRDGVCPDRGPPALSSPPSPGFPGHRLLEDIGQEQRLISRGTARHDTHVENVAITTNHIWRFSTQLNFKWIVPYLIFWMVMGCGIARFDRGAPKLDNFGPRFCLQRDFEWQRTWCTAHGTSNGGQGP